MVKRTVVLTDEMEAKIRAAMKAEHRSFSFVVREAVGQLFKITEEFRHGAEDE